MRILLIMDPGIPVPPPLYGGHERLVYLFAGEYRRRGHQVTLLAGPGSYCGGDTITFGVNDLNRSRKQKFKECVFVWKFLRMNKDNFDLIHNFGRLAYLLPVLNCSLKKIMTYGRPVAATSIKIVNAVPNQNIIFTACSNYCVSTGNVAGEWKTVYNAIDFSKYKLTETLADDAPLFFLGRIDRIKGAHTAIKVAKAMNHPLVIAGNIDNSDYFKKEIELHIDGRQIRYIGALNDAEKNHYLGQAKALLFPIEWDEPFGMVMIESMACGTPVIAFNRGSVPEVVENGVTGFVVNTDADMISKISDLYTISRKICREAALAKFEARRVAGEYLSLFNQYDQKNS
jgi:glycosyltransferase involved in cell wall biosynthesis